MRALDSFEKVNKIALLVKEQGGEAYFVGGFVRDSLLGIESKDIDVEVHGIRPETLEKILDGVGEWIEIGKSFGIYSLRGTNIDIAMPRRETLTGIGHRDFKIDVDPFMGTENAAKRRDFTVNALMQNVLTGEIIDHFGGQKDLKDKVLRHVCDTSFPEDPLRVLRGVQFAARFNLEVAPETIALCQKIDVSTLSSERVLEELKKALLQSEKPSVFFETLRKMNQLSPWFEEVEKLIGVLQSTIYHKEGDVYTHTMMVLDEAAKMRDSAEKPFYFMMSALVHDFGKITATKFYNGNYHATGHEEAGIYIAGELLRKLTNENALISYVLNMTGLHTAPRVLFNDNASVKASNKMFDVAENPADLIKLSLCDGLGKIPRKPMLHEESFLMKRLEIYKEYMARPYVTGQDLIDMGMKPGKEFSELLSNAHEMRLSGVMKETALSTILAEVRKKELLK